MMAGKYLVETIKKQVNGKEKSYTLRTPLSAWEIAQDGGNSGGSDNSGGDGDGNGDDV
jgi:hypothetical protein